MLNRLQVRNYVLIDSLEIDFPEGLIIITGQTGAGKSILLGALSLITGAKADAAMISSGAENCVVEAEFDVNPSDDELRTVLDENEVEWEGGHLIIRRVVNRSGRSRAFVNDSPVSMQVLQSIASRIVDVHSQHQTLLLSDRQFQLNLLDLYACNTELRAKCASLWKLSLSIKSEISHLDEKIAKVAADRDYNQAQYNQLDVASLREGELEELEEEQKQLANAEEIKMSLGCAEELLLQSSYPEMMSVDTSLKETVRCLSKAGRFLPAVNDLSDRVESCRRELDDVLSEISSMNARIEMSQDRLEQVEARMSLLYGLLQKHSCRTMTELIAERDRYSQMLFDSTTLQQKRDSLSAELEKVTAEFNVVSSDLHDSRLKSSKQFSEEIQKTIREMELPFAVFEVHLSEQQAGPSGTDAVSYVFSASGKNLVDVARCASGGEMSRIMLALKSLMARYTKMPTMIFDEIDTGVSGSVADKMGSLICSMGNYMQVFAITHLPQVAAKGTAHYVVTKDIDPLTSEAVSKIERLSYEQRVLELARMLSGSVLTDEAVANAKSLLKS